MIQRILSTFVTPCIYYILVYVSANRRLVRVYLYTYDDEPDGGNPLSRGLNVYNNIIILYIVCAEVTARVSDLRPRGDPTCIYGLYMHDYYT